MTRISSLQVVGILVAAFAGVQMSITPSVTSPGTTSAPEARWSVRDENGAVCMLMDFEGTVSILDENVPYRIPSSATADASTCSSSSFAAFVLEFHTDVVSSWRVALNFATRGSSYQLREVQMKLFRPSTFLMSTLESENFPLVPLGDYYTCNFFNQSDLSFKLNLTKPSFQPFVKNTNEGNNFGQPYHCLSDNSTMTTASGQTGTTPSVTSSGTTSAPEARWSVKDEDGAVCMLMDFEGTVSSIRDDDFPYLIPSSAASDQSNCSSSSNAAFVLEFDIDMVSFCRVVLNFTTRGSSYHLSDVTMIMFSIGSSISFSETQNFFDVPLGDYYTCNFFNQSLGYFKLNLTKPSFQPFVQKTKGRNNFGQPYLCPSGNENINVGIIIGIIIAVIVLIIAGIVVTFCLVKRRGRTSGPPYVRT